MLAPTSRADTADPTAEEKLPEFVSEVVRLDMTKYNITDETYGFHYPSEYGGITKEESTSFNLVSDRGTIYTARAHARFLDGFICSLTVNAPTNSQLFFVDPPTNALDESKKILQRYKIFAEKYGFETSHIDQALILLSNATGASAPSPDLLLFNDVTGFVPSVTYSGNMKQEITEDSVTWVYTEKGVAMSHKCLKIDLGGKKLHFVDTWNLFTVGCFSAISEEEAIRIGWNEAKNYNLTLIGEAGPYNPEFEWSNRTYVKLDMIPGQIDNTTAEDHTVNQGNATRDPLALYPYWFMVFYFDKPVPAGRRSIPGIAVGLWGDTLEIGLTGLAEHMGVTGEHPYLTNDTSIEDPEENSTKSENSNAFSNAYLIGGIAAVSVTAIVVAAVALKKRRKTQNTPIMRAIAFSESGIFWF